MFDLREFRYVFETMYDGEPQLFRAPGRVNLIGEHTDYNDGFVLPMAIERQVVVAASPRTDRIVRVCSRSIRKEDQFDLDRPGPKQRRSWLDYVEGVAQMLLAKGARIGGANLLIDSDVPTGAGLSSSAAIEMAVGYALLSASGATLEKKDLALAGQAAEHQYVGTRCGIMDQYISALGQADHALLIDCRSLEPSAIPLKLSGVSVLVTDTKVKHSLAASAYNDRRAECEQGASQLGVKALRDISVEDFQKRADSLPKPVQQRCRHVVTENARTLQAAEALKSGDLERMGKLMADSHASLRDDYEVSCPELDLLVEVALGTKGVIGSRMTGGGFGGCTVSLVRDEALKAVQETLAAGFEKRFGKKPGFLVTRAAAGVGALQI